MASNYDIANSISILCNNKTSAEIDHIVKSIVDNNVRRAKTILSILKSKQEMSDRTITIISANEISDRQKDELAQSLNVNKDSIIFTIDTNVIAGVVVKIGDQIIDSSLATRITKLQNILTKTNVN
jgi:F0F1-type ATP synthase delta subunit